MSRAAVALEYRDFSFPEDVFPMIIGFGRIFLDSIPLPFLALCFLGCVALLHGPIVVHPPPVLPSHHHHPSITDKSRLSPITRTKSLIPSSPFHSSPDSSATHNQNDELDEFLEKVEGQSPNHVNSTTVQFTASLAQSPGGGRVWIPRKGSKAFLKEFRNGLGCVEEDVRDCVEVV